MVFWFLFWNFNFKSHSKQCPTRVLIFFMIPITLINLYQFCKKSQDWWCTILRKKTIVSWFGWSAYHWFTTDTDNLSLVDDHITIKQKGEIFWNCMHKKIILNSELQKHRWMFVHILYNQIYICRCWSKCCQLLFSQQPLWVSMQKKKGIL